MGKMVIPKNSASLDEVMGAMQIYYDKNDWLSNADYIQAYKARIGIIGDDTDSSAYTKKTEIGAYYGFIEWQDISKTQSPRRITPRGRQFLEHYTAKSTPDIFEDIMRSLEEVTFGRNNFACRSCDSDIDAPALFLRAVLDLKHLTNTEFAYLVYKMEYEAKHYTESIDEIKVIRSKGQKIVLPDEARKFSDPKPILMLERWGVLSSRQENGSKETFISSAFDEKYHSRLRNLKIYNIDKNIDNNNPAASTPESTHEQECPIHHLPILAPRTNKKYPLNCILYGAPGTGKTYATAQYALAIAEGKDLQHITQEKRSDVMMRYNELVKSGQVVFTTFHQNYGYEDFIQGIRPYTSGENVCFRTCDGIFKAIADRAANNPQRNYIIIIDEINRANISKVFGELITLIEEDKRWGEINAVSVVLPSGEIFAVPNNLYIIGTMNSADKSISLIDTALRRRFDFIEFVPNINLIQDNSLKSVLSKLNTGISTELGSTDLLIGHSFFIGKSIDDLDNIMNRNIIPLLYEYFFDNQKKVAAQVNNAIDGLNVEIKPGIVGRITLVKKGTQNA